MKISTLRDGRSTVILKQQLIFAINFNMAFSQTSYVQITLCSNQYCCSIQSRDLFSSESSTRFLENSEELPKLVAA